MPTKYVRLTDSEREEISRGLARGEAMRRIAATIGRSPSTVSREVAACLCLTGYRAVSAARASRRRASSRRSGKSRLAANPRLREEVHRLVLARLSPEQVSAKLRAV